MKPAHVAIGVFWLGSLLLSCSLILWFAFIQPYLRRNGVRPGSPFFNWSVLFDYRKARQIADARGRKPWFLKAFEIVTASALLLGIGFIIWIITTES